MGRTCGRRERRGRRGQIARVATVKGTLIRKQPSAFAGRRHNAHLGRSVAPARGSFPGRSTHRRQRVSSGKMRRGTSSACAKRPHSPSRRPTSAYSNGDTSFARSRDPCTSIVTETSWRRCKPQPRRWRDDSDIAVGQTHESGRNRHRGLGRTDDCAARRPSPLLSLRSRSPSRSCVSGQKRKVVMAIVPARKRESRAQCPHVVFSCRSRQAASWSRISSNAAPQKGWRFE